MDEKVLEELLEELFSALETLETQNRAILEFLKRRGMASDRDFAPFVEEAAKASNVRWRATRIRVNHLLAGAFKANQTAQPIPASTAEDTEENQDQQATDSSKDRSDSEEQERTREKTGPEPKNRKGAEQEQTSENRQEGSAADKPGNVDKPENKNAA